MNIYIEHNPFLCETIFKLDGNEIGDKTTISEYKTQRLQLWVENIFEDIYKIANKNTSFDVVFKGTETDFNDIGSAIDVSNQAGMQIRLKEYIEVSGGNERLIKLQQLMNEAMKHEILGEKMTENPEIRKNMDAAFDKNFDVYVAATMSAGKSTLINAILHSDLLPAANEATTATIAEIHDDSNIQKNSFIGSRFNKEHQLVDDEQKITLEKLKQWNSQKDTSLIKIRGNIPAFQKRDNIKLVITDTPGPNNSQDKSHNQTTLDKIADKMRHPVILYILNASQLGINDDKNTLEMIAQKMQDGGKQSKDRFIFIVNKMDVFDPEKGESVEAALERVKIYLKSCGIQNPVCYPVSANLSRLLRLDKDKLTRTDRGELNKLEELFREESSMDFPCYMNLSNAVRKNLESSNLSLVEKRSGIPAVEMMLDEYIEKYNLPNRVNRAYKALNSAIVMSETEAEINKNIDLSDQEIQKIEQMLDSLEQKKDKAISTYNYIDDFSVKNIELPKIVQDRINMHRSYIKEVLRNFGNNFLSSNCSVSKAEELLDKLKDQVQVIYQQMIASYSNDLKESEEAIKNDLIKNYKKRLKQLFDGIEDINLPLLSGFKVSMENLTLTGLGLDNNEIKTERVEAYRESQKKWYNPFSWLKDDRVTYRTERSVDLENIWGTRADEIAKIYNGLFEQYEKQLIKQKDTLADRYINFMDEQFKPKFDALLASIKQNINDKENHEKLIKEAKDKLEEIAKFKQKVDQVLAL